MPKIDPVNRAARIDGAVWLVEESKKRLGVDLDALARRLRLDSAALQTYLDGTASPTGLRRIFLAVARATLTDFGRLPSDEELDAAARSFKSRAQVAAIRLAPPPSAPKVERAPEQAPLALAPPAAPAPPVGIEPTGPFAEIARALPDDVILWELARRMAARS